MPKPKTITFRARLYFLLMGIFGLTVTVCGAVLCSAMFDAEPKVAAPVAFLIMNLPFLCLFGWGGGRFLWIFLRYHLSISDTEIINRGWLGMKHLKIADVRGLLWNGSQVRISDGKQEVVIDLELFGRANRERIIQLLRGLIDESLQVRWDEFVANHIETPERRWQKWRKRVLYTAFIFFGSILGILGLVGVIKLITYLGVKEYAKIFLACFPYLLILLNVADYVWRRWRTGNWFHAPNTPYPKVFEEVTDARTGLLIMLVMLGCMGISVAMTDPNWFYFILLGGLALNFVGMYFLGNLRLAYAKKVAEQKPEE
ncbi:MAG: hypothetical protein SFX18_05690 [Pirellulales bacterium]|nr:hypothetical protein [Pirellulales bacterium]